MAEKENINILKIREESEPIEFKYTTENKISLCTGVQAPTWFPTNEGGTILSDLRGAIEPWLTSLFQSEHLSLLVGTGLSTAVHFVATRKCCNMMSDEPKIDSEYASNIKNKAGNIAQKSNRGKANIEDHIRVINELLRGLEVLGYDSATDENKVKYDKLTKSLEDIIENFVGGLSDIERGIALAGEKQTEKAFGCLVNFLMSFASRIGTRERLNIFTTNYDRLIEAGAELAGLHLLDRFVGSLVPIFRSSRLDIDMHYNPPGIRGEPRYLEGVARFTKLHGSIDWINTGADIRRIGLPFGTDKNDINNFLKVPGIADADVKKIMIYPNAAKDRETTEYPYVELFRDFAVALCRPNSTLVTYGYGFGDDHINRIIRDMLTIPSTHLVIISYDDVGGRVMNKYTEFGRSSQISLIIGKVLADIENLVAYFLPKPSIDRASVRMNELLKQRYPIQKNESTKNANGGDSAE